MPVELNPRTVNPQCCVLGSKRDCAVQDALLIGITAQRIIGKSELLEDGRVLRAAVVCVQGHTATVRITMACTDVPIGSYLKAYEPVPIPLARRGPPAVACDPPSGKIQGRIVYTRDGVVAIGSDSDVLIDVGVAEGIQPGDQLNIFRFATGADYGIRPQGSYWVYTPPPPGVEIPRTYLGDLAVLYVGDRWAVGRVVDSSRLIEVGDEVEVK